MSTKTKEVLRPLQDRLIVKRIDPETESAGGILLPKAAQERPKEGTVIAVGAGRVDDNGKRIPMDVKLGDHVIFAPYAGGEVNVNGEKHLIMNELDVLAIVE